MFIYNQPRHWRGRVRPGNDAGERRCVRAYEHGGWARGGCHTGGMWRVLRLTGMKTYGILIFRVPQSEMGISWGNTELLSIKQSIQKKKKKIRDKTKIEHLLSFYIFFKNPGRRKHVLYPLYYIIIYYLFYIETGVQCWIKPSYLCC